MLVYGQKVQRWKSQPICTGSFVILIELRIHHGSYLFNKLDFILLITKIQLLHEIEIVS